MVGRKQPYQPHTYTRKNFVNFSCCSDPSHSPLFTPPSFLLSSPLPSSLLSSPLLSSLLSSPLLSSLHPSPPLSLFSFLPSFFLLPPLPPSSPLLPSLRKRSVVVHCAVDVPFLIPWRKEGSHLRVTPYPRVKGWRVRWRKCGRRRGVCVCVCVCVWVGGWCEGRESE